MSSGAKLDFIDHQGNNVIHLAMHSNIDLVQILLTDHSNPKQLINARNEEGISCLGLLLTYLPDDWLTIIQVFVECGADVQENDSDGNNLLHLAIARPHRNVDAIKNVMTALST